MMRRTRSLTLCDFESSIVLCSNGSQFFTLKKSQERVRTAIVQEDANRATNNQSDQIQSKEQPGQWTWKGALVRELLFCARGVPTVSVCYAMKMFSNLSNVTVVCGEKGVLGTVSMTATQLVFFSTVASVFNICALLLVTLSRGNCRYYQIDSKHKVWPSILFICALACFSSLFLFFFHNLLKRWRAWTEPATRLLYIFFNNIT